MISFAEMSIACVDGVIDNLLHIQAAMVPLVVGNNPRPLPTILSRLPGGDCDRFPNIMSGCLSLAGLVEEQTHALCQLDKGMLGLGNGAEICTLKTKVRWTSLASGILIVTHTHRHKRNHSRTHFCSSDHRRQGITSSEHRIA